MEKERKNKKEEKRKKKKKEKERDHFCQCLHTIRKPKFLRQFLLNLTILTLNQIHSLKY